MLGIEFKDCKKVFGYEIGTSGIIGVAVAAAASIPFVVVYIVMPLNNGGISAESISPIVLFWIAMIILYILAHILLIIVLRHKLLSTY